MDDMTCIEIVKLLKKIIKQMKMKMNKAVLSRDGESKHDDVSLDYLELYMNNITKTNSLKVQKHPGIYIVVVGLTGHWMIYSMYLDGKDRRQCLVVRIKRYMLHTVYTTHYIYTHL